jgi:DNA-binding transcriptional MocR family regulator
VRSTAKYLGPDLRLAVVAGDALTVRRVEGRFGVGPRRVSLLLQQLVLALWSDPSAGRQLARTAGIYAQRRQALRAALEGHGIASHGATGLNAWIPVPHESRVIAALAERGWAVAAGEPFRLRRAPGIRLTIATLAPDAAARFAEDLAAARDAGERPSA